ncbi:MAG: ATP-binding protein [Chlamydiae bacterium]|nr:ATP-binding protein [Chlamydiota bacterium]
MIDQELLKWKDAKDRKVLLVRGARQVGKTFSIRNLGRHFEHFLEVNLEKEPKIHAIFDGTLDPKIINEKLSAYFGTPIILQKTLLFFDEIQACPNALRSLRFYYEEMPKLHVISAGSLLEFALSEIPSFGVGRISSIFMYPMTFSEFLWANGGASLHELVLQAGPTQPLDTFFHEQLLEKLKTYQILGGMPAVVQYYIKTKDLRECQHHLGELLTNLQDDFSKYKKRAPVSKLREVFEAIVHQSGGKFKYSKISENASSSSFKEALDLLIMAGLAHKIHHTSARGIPLGAQIDPKKFKVILFDLGIHHRLLGLDLSEFILRSSFEMIHKGNLAEIFTGLELIAHSSPRSPAHLYYWHRESRASNAEVDYVIQNQDQIIPLEVKAGTKGQMQSLFLFLEERNLPLGIRISHENFSEFGKIEARDWRERFLHSEEHKKEAVNLHT